MPKTIVQKITYKNTTPKALYDIYMNTKKHSTATGAPARITAKEGAKYSAHGGYITGRNLQLIPDRLIVQSWRASEWKKEDVDSTFIIHLEPKGKNTVLHAIHSNVPDANAAALSKGWHDHYWEPFRLFLAGTPIARSPEM